jgi:protein tyrosine/serine phosphatase
MADDSDERIINERSLVKKLGIQYVHLRTNSSRYQTKVEAYRAIAGLRAAEPPVLIHCADGTHRTGFFAALWLLLREGKSVEEASSQLSLEYGFFSLERSLKRFRIGRPLLDDSFFEFVRVSETKDILWQDWVESNL